MRRRGVRASVLTMVWALLAGAAVAADAVPIGPQRQLQLVRIVRQDCGSCHGMRLTGGLGPALTREAQMLCFLAGANSIFYGDKLLTTANNDVDDDLALIEEAGLRIKPACAT